MCLRAIQDKALCPTARAIVGYDIGSLDASGSTKRRMDNETAADTGLSFQDEVKREMIEITDR